MTLRIAAVQLLPTIGEVDANVSRAVGHVRGAATAGAQLIVLPELATTGYVFESRDEASSLAEPIPEGPTSAALAELTAELEVYLVIGMAERCGDSLYNSAAVFGPTGYMGLFRKVHLWDNENTIFKPGNLGFPVFSTPVGRLGVMICYDAWFPESYRSCALAGAQIVCIPTNWVPIPGQDPASQAMATVLCMASAHCNGVVVVAADRIGVERGQPFIGQSTIVSHTGWPIAGPASPDREEVLYADIDLEVSRAHRRWNRFNDPLLDRRPDSYSLTLLDDAS